VFVGAALPQWGRTCVRSRRVLVPPLGAGDHEVVVGVPPSSCWDTSPLGQNSNPPPAGAALPQWGENLCSLTPHSPVGGEPFRIPREHWFRPMGAGDHEVVVGVNKKRGDAPCFLSDILFEIVYCSHNFNGIRQIR